MADVDDEDLRYALDSVAPPPPDVDAAYGRLGPRIARYRRHRRLAAGAVVAGALLASGVAGLAVRSTEGAHVDIVDRPPSTTSSLPLPTTTTPPTVVPTEPATSAPPPPSESPAAVESPTAEQGAAPTASSSGSDTTPAAARPGTARTSSSAQAPAATTEPTTLAPPTTVVRPSTPATTGASPTAPVVTQRFSSNGGSVTVRTDGQSLSLVAVEPVPGWQVDEEHVGSSQVDVKFRRSDQEAELRVSLVNGRLHQIYDD